MNLTTRQKILIPLIIIALLYLAWELYDIFATPKSVVSKPPVPTSAPAIKQQLPVQAPPNTTPNIEINSTNPTTVTPPTVTAPTSKEESDTESGLTSQQSIYLKLLNQYQLLKMKHMLLEEEVAIATARQKISELSAQSGGTLTETDYLVGDYGTTQPGEVSTSMDDVGYSVIYIDYQDGRWHATLNVRGQFETVASGTTLSDGATVISINRQQVIVKKGSKLYKLTLGGTTLLSPSNEPKESTATDNSMEKLRSLISEQQTKIDALTKKAQSTADGSVSTPAIAPPTPQTPSANPPPVVKPTLIPVVTPSKPEKKFSASTIAPTRIKAKTHPRKSSKCNGPLKKIVRVSRLKEVGPIKEVTTPEPSAPTPTVVSPIPLNGAQSQKYAEISSQQSGISDRRLGANVRSVSMIHEDTNNDVNNPENLNAKNVTNTQLPSNAKPYYVLQIMSHNSYQALVTFAKNNHLQQAYYLTTTENGKTLYVLVYGKYNSIAEAKEALTTLPSAAKALKPWVRPIENGVLTPIH